MRDVMLIVHFIGLAMGLGTSFAHLFLGIASQKLSPEEGMKFRMHTMALRNMGHIGIILLILSGGYLMTPYWEVLHLMPFMIAKLILVLILVALILYIGQIIKKAKEGNAEMHLKKLQPIGKLTLIITLAIVVCAVMNFH
jgi:uncharacterized membrane protein